MHYRTAQCGQSLRWCGQQRMARACQFPIGLASSPATCRTPSAPRVTSPAALSNCLACIAPSLLYFWICPILFLAPSCISRLLHFIIICSGGMSLLIQALCDCMLRFHVALCLPAGCRIVYLQLELVAYARTCQSKYSSALIAMNWSCSCIH